PQRPERLYALDHATDAFALRDAEGVVLHLPVAATAFAADARREDEPVGPGDLIDRRPLRGEQHGVADGKAGHAADRETNVPRARRKRGQQRDRLRPSLGEDRVTDPDALEDTARVGFLAHAQEVFHRLDAEQNPAVRKREAE